MRKKLNIVNQLHKQTKRDYLGRMKDDKIHCMEVAKKYGYDYWDGDRRYGYGGYKYDGRWSVVAEKLIEYYKLPEDAKILDVGCGKAFLLYELKKKLPNCEIRGFDSSQYALDHAKEEIKDKLFFHRAQDRYPFKEKKFDLVISLTTLHNLPIYHLKSALQEMERVAKNKYLVVESFHNERELFNLQCWALTCESFYTPNEWKWLFKEFSYTGDYELIFFE